MTIRQTIETRLVDHGLWPDEAKTIMDDATNADTLQEMRKRWDDDVSGYPAPLLAVVWISVKTIALEWLEKNKPMHFAKAVLSA